MSHDLFARLQSVAPPRPKKKKPTPDWIRYPQGDLFGEPVRSPGWSPRAGNFASVSREKMAAQCRGVLIERLDSLLAQQCEVWEAEFAELNPALVRRLLIKFVQDAQIRLFPEEFADDDGTAARIQAETARKDGLVPPEGTIERVGWERFAAYAESLGVEYDAPEESPTEPTTMIGGVEVPVSELAVLKQRQPTR